MCASRRGSPKRQKDAERGGERGKKVCLLLRTRSQGMGWRKGIRRGGKKSFSGRFFCGKFMRDSQFLTVSSPSSTRSGIVVIPPRFHSSSETVPSES